MMSGMLLSPAAKAHLTQRNFTCRAVADALLTRVGRTLKVKRSQRKGKRSVKPKCLGGRVDLNNLGEREQVNKSKGSEPKHFDNIK